jgi:hypothetical protein
MIKPFSLFFLASTLFFSNCGCGNSDVGEGPKSEDSISEDTKSPKFSLSLADGASRENLYARHPIQLVLKDENFSKHGITTYKLPPQKGEGGIFHLMDANGKAGERIDHSELIEVPSGELSLIFVPSGKVGKNIIGIELQNQVKGDSFQVSMELSLKKEEPKFSLELAEGMKKEDLNTNQPIPLVLKGENLLEAEYLVDKLEVEKGTLHFMDNQGKTGEEIRGREVLIFKDGALPLMFVPSGKVGENSIKISFKLKRNVWRGGETKLNLDLKNILTASLPEFVRTGKLEPFKLKINADPEQEFTIKSITPQSGNVEIFYDNGEKAGVWGEVNPVRIGDKLKGGKEYELDFKKYGFYDKVNGGEVVFKGREEKFAYYPHVKRSIEVVIVDDKGNEYKEKVEFKIKDLSFNFNIKGINWLNLGEGKIDDLGVYQIEYELQTLQCNAKDEEYGKDCYKILSFRASDNTRVSLLDYFLKNMVGEKPSTDLPDLYLRLDEMNLNMHGKPMIINMKIQGPGGDVQSVDIEIAPEHKEYILWGKIDSISHWANQRQIDLIGVWLSDTFPVQKHAIAQKAGEGAAAFIKRVHKKCAQVESVEKLGRYISSQTREKMKFALEMVEKLKGRIDFINKEYGLNIEYKNS